MISKRKKNEQIFLCGYNTQKTNKQKKPQPPCKQMNFKTTGKKSNSKYFGMGNEELNIVI